VLGAFVAAGHVDTAETLGWALLESSGGREPAEALALARAALLAAPGCEELRRQTAELYKAVHGGHEHFQTLYEAAGLEAGQSPKRAVRTLETCLAVHPGAYLANRFDGRVIRVQRLNAMGEFEFDDAGRTVRLEPKLLADEFDLLPETDFRVRLLADPQGLADMFRNDPAAVLMSISQARGGRVTSDDLKGLVVPQFLPKDKWSGWWGRARTAAKKCPQLTLEGRSPVTLIYHPQGRSLEDEFADAAGEAYHPLEQLAVLRTYLREASGRGASPDGAFVSRIVSAMADRLRSSLPRRPGEAFQAALALDAASAIDVSRPGDDLPRPADVLARADAPAEIIARLAKTDLWPAALEALRARPDAAEQFERLLHLAPAEHLDAVADGAVALGRADAPARAVTEAFADATHHLELCLWAWAGPAKTISDLPNRTTILCKLLDALFEIDHHWTGDGAARREARRKVRSALAADHFAAFRRVVDEIDTAMGAVVKGKIERTDGLAQTVREKMLHGLRQKHHELFLRKKAPPWEDERVIWTSESALQARREDLRVLLEEKIPANAKQIGEAAAQGDLSENADWEAAIAERDLLAARAHKIQDELLRARALRPEDVPTDTVGVGSRVRLRHAETGEEIELTFLGPWDSAPERRVYAYTTRLALDLMGKALGTSLSYEIDGRRGGYTIVAISSAV